MLGRSVFVAALAVCAPAHAWSLDREALRPALLAANDEVARCARAHAAPNGRYVFWIVVDDRGHARATVRENPWPLSDEARRCLSAAYEQQRYPAPLEATVAWSSNSRPGRTYSISLPIELAANRYGYDTLDGPLERGRFARGRIRPAPARARHLARLGRPR